MDMDWWQIGGGAILAAPLIVLLAGLLYIRRLKRRIAGQEALLRSLERDMQAVCLGARGMGDAVAKLERKLRKLTERQDTLDLRDPDSQLYRHAITLVRRGAGVQELVSSCGITAGEAELIHLLHRQVPSQFPTDTA